MALITNTTDVTPDSIVRWRIPVDGVLNESFIPRSMITFDGAVAIATLGAGDTLRFRIRFMFPTNNFYLLKILSFNFASDDGTVKMNTNGLATFNTGDGNFHNVIQSSPVTEYSTAQALVYQYSLVEPVPSVLLSGHNGDHFIIALADIAGDSIAGDCFYHLVFYQFDVEQASNFPVHTQLPIRT